MKRVIIGMLMINLTILEPLIGWLIMRDLGLSDGYQFLIGFLGTLAILFQLVMYGMMVVMGYQKEGIIPQ